MAKKTLIMEHSKYWFEYEEGKEYDFRVFRGNEDVTELVKNNVLCDLFYETLGIKEKHAIAMDRMMEWYIKRREAVPFEDFILGRIKPEKKEEQEIER